MGLLEAVTLFEGLSDAQIARIEALCELFTAPAGHTLSEEDAEAHDFYILLDGKVSISKKLRLPDLEALQAEDRTLTVLDSARRPVLGETALVGGTHRLATMTCVTECRLVRINAQRLTEYLASDCAAGHSVFRNLALMVYRRLEASNTDVVKLSAALVYALQT